MVIRAGATSLYQVMIHIRSSYRVEFIYPVQLPPTFLSAFNPMLYKKRG